MSVSLWPAPTAATPVEATVRLPGSKSVTNRALLLAALAEGPGEVRLALRSRDADLMAAALRALGAGLTPSNESVSGVDWHVVPGPVLGGASIDVGLAGTVMRFVPPMAALADGEVAFDGDPHARKRPMGPILAALRALGAEVGGDAPAVHHPGAGSPAARSPWTPRRPRSSSPGCCSPPPGSRRA